MYIYVVVVVVVVVVGIIYSIPHSALSSEEPG